MALAWPIAMNAILLQAIVIIDITLVAPLGEVSVAALGLASSLVGIALGVLFALSNGTQILLAQAYGANNTRAFRSAFWCGLVINIVSFCLFAVLALAFGPMLLDSLATTAQMGALAWDYTRVFLLVLAGVALSQNCTVLFNAIGNSRIPFYSNLLELPINAIISYALINGAFGFPELGLEGAAWGSAVAVCIRTVFLGLFLIHQKSDVFAGSGELFKQFRKQVSHHWLHAWPVAATFITLSLSMSLCMMMYASLPVHEFAALTILMLWIRIAGLVVTAWAQATSILIGQLLGKSQNALLDEFLNRVWRLSFVLAGVVAGINLCSSFGFPSIYPELQSTTLDVLAALAPMFVVLPLLRSSNVMCGNVLRAGGDAGYAFRIHIYTQCLFTLPVSAFFVFYLKLNVQWVFSILLAEEVIKAFPFHKRIRSGIWKRQLQ